MVEYADFLRDPETHDVGTHRTIGLTAFVRSAIMGVPLKVPAPWDNPTNLRTRASINSLAHKEYGAGSYSVRTFDGELWFCWLKPEDRKHRPGGTVIHVANMSKGQ